MKNSNNTIWNRTRDPPAGSVVPQPTAPPSACPDDMLVTRIIVGSNNRMSVKGELDKMWEEAVVTYPKASWWDLCGGTEEKRRMLCEGSLLCLRKPNCGLSLVQFRSVTD
jgi:hypothetical protein